MIFLRTISLLGLLLLLAACENLLVREVSPEELTRGENKLVLQCYLSPQDTAIVAAVSLSRPVLGEQANARGVLPGATVLLEDGDRSIALTYDAQKLFYWAPARQFPIQAGRTYRIAVSLPGYASVGATTTVPPPVPITEVQLDSSASQGYIGVDYYVRVLWRDPVDQVNFYQVAGDTEYGGREYVFGSPGQPGYFKPSRQIGHFFYEENSPFLIDQERDGGLMVSPRGQLSFAYSDGRIQADPPILVRAYLLKSMKAIIDTIRRWSATTRLAAIRLPNRCQFPAMLRADWGALGR